jgi:hypothetical protein
MKESPDIPQINARSRLLEATGRLQELLDSGQLHKGVTPEVQAIIAELKYIGMNYPNRLEQTLDTEDPVESAALLRAKSEVDSDEFDVQG